MGPRDRAPPGCSPTTAPTSCGSNRPAAIRCDDAHPEAVSVLDRGKRSVELDLHDAAAREQLLALIDRAEVFVESWRPGVADRLGLGYDVLHARNPAMVYVSISGFGEDSDARPARLRTDRAGRARRHVRPGRAPRRPGVPRVPLRQHRRGVARGDRRARRPAPRPATMAAAATSRPRCSTARSPTTRCCGARATRRWPRSGDAPLPMQQTATTRLVTRSFECGDGEYLGPAHRARSVRSGGRCACSGSTTAFRPAPTAWTWACPSPTSRSRSSRFELVEIFKTRPRAEWVQRFLDADVCAVEHLRPTEVYDTPQARHNGMVVTVDDPVLGPVEQVAPAIKFSQTPGAVRTARADGRRAHRRRARDGRGLARARRRRRRAGARYADRCSTACTSSTSARTTRVRTRRGCSPTSAPTS